MFKTLEDGGENSLKHSHIAPEPSVEHCSARWFGTALACNPRKGRPAIRAADVDKKLATGEFDALTLIHNETSTGVMSPLNEIAALWLWTSDPMDNGMTTCASKGGKGFCLIT